MRIAHLSDVHFGRIAYPEIVEALIHEVNASGVDLVAFSGDLTQRALPEQFQAAAAMIAAFEAPTLVVPGNHDVFAWWHDPFRRVFAPVSRFQAMVTQDLRPTYQSDGVAVMGLNSAHGQTIKGGRIRRADMDAMHAFFSHQSAETFKVLVLHHHLTKIQALGRHDIARRARRALALAAEAGVDLILCGHLHVSHIEPVEIIPGVHRLVIVSAGTATSNRGRHDHKNTNFYNRIEIGRHQFTVEERRYDPERHRFVEDCTSTFKR